VRHTRELPGRPCVHDPTAPVLPDLPEDDGVLLLASKAPYECRRLVTSVLAPNSPRFGGTSVPEDPTIKISTPSAAENR
jgi:hypothetical protein